MLTQGRRAGGCYLHRGCRRTTRDSAEPPASMWRYSTCQSLSSISSIWWHECAEQQLPCITSDQAGASKPPQTVWWTAVYGPNDSGHYLINFFSLSSPPEQLWPATTATRLHGLSDSPSLWTGHRCWRLYSCPFLCLIRIHPTMLSGACLPFTAAPPLIRSLAGSGRTWCRWNGCLGG